MGYATLSHSMEWDVSDTWLYSVCHNPQKHRIRLLCRLDEYDEVLFICNLKMYQKARLEK
jgi:hypothetical protein